MIDLYTKPYNTLSIQSNILVDGFLFIFSSNYFERQVLGEYEDLMGEALSLLFLHLSYYPQVLMKTQQQYL